MMSRDPWFELSIPPSAGTVSGRRVDTRNPWNFFWARDTTGKYLLVLVLSPHTAPDNVLPKLKGIDVSISNHENRGERALTFTLRDSSHRDIFNQLCIDIVTSAAGATNERAALDIVLKRTWRWHHLLRGGTDQRLSEEEQMGLIGELLVIEKYLLPHFSAFDSISAWRGPLDAPKDFAIGGVGIEAKARRGEASPFVVISSEYQLDEKGLNALFLCVFAMDRATLDSAGHFSVSALAERIRAYLDRTEPSSLSLFESRLTASGFRWDDDYSDVVWSEGPGSCFRVAGQFPRIVADGIAAGVQDLKYSISLPECEPYRVSDDTLLAVLTGARDVERNG